MPVNVDYSLLDRPMFFFTYDYGGVREGRGTYFDLLERAPGPVVRTEEELHAVLDSLEEQKVKYAAPRERFVADFGEFDQGNAAQSIVDQFFSQWRRVTAYSERDVFFVSNSVDELGGVTSWSHQMARLFTERGHRVHVIGITEPAVVQELGELPLPHHDVVRRPPAACGLRTASRGGSTSPRAGCVPNGPPECASRPPS